MDDQAKRLTFTGLWVLLLFGLTVFLAGAACTPKQTTPMPQAKTSPSPGGAASVTPAPAAPEKTALDKLVQAAKQEGQVTVYSYSMAGDTGLAAAQAFKDKYGIPVNILSGRGAEMTERIRTEQRMGRVVADVMNVNPLQMYSIKDTNGTVSSADIPVLQEKDVWLIEPTKSDKEGHVLVWAMPAYLGFINTRLVKPEDEPKSLRDLTQPKWAGKMVIQDPSVASPPYGYFNTLLRGGFTDTKTVQAIGRNKTAFEINTASMVTALANGTYAMNPGAADQLYSPLILQGAPIKAIAFQEGTVLSSLGIGVINKAPHPNSAKLFVNWVLTKEGQTTLLKNLNILSPRKDVPDFRPEALRMPPAGLIATTQEDEIANNQALLDKVLVKLWKD